MDKPKIDEFGGGSGSAIASASGDPEPENFNSDKSSCVCGGGLPERRGSDYKDIDEIVEIGCYGNMYTMKEIIDFDDEAFDVFYNQMLKFFNEELFSTEILGGTDRPSFELVSNFAAAGIAAARTQALFATQIVMNRRENRRLERKIDSLLQQ